MTTGSASNYGGSFGFPSGTAYPCLVIDYPELKMAAVDITNHAGGGVTEYIPSGLLDVGEFTLSILGQHGTYGTLKAAQVAKTVNVCSLTNPLDSMVFSGMLTSIKEEPADAKSPDAVKLTVTVRPTGNITIANTP
jgi:hypothetical protein